MSEQQRNSSSDLKLPSGPSARRRTPLKGDEWVDFDTAERRRPILAFAIIGALFLAGLALIVSSINS